MTPEEIGLCYVRAAEILRSTGEFGGRRKRELSVLNHTYQIERTQVPSDAEVFAGQIERLALQVRGDVSAESFRSEFVVNLEAFSRLYADEGDVERLRKHAQAYVPVRLSGFLALARRATREKYYGYQVGIGSAYRTSIQLSVLGTGFRQDSAHTFNRDFAAPPEYVATCAGHKRTKTVRLNIPFGLFRIKYSRVAELVLGPMSWDLHSTSLGYRIRNRRGLLTSTLIILMSCIPVIVYLSLRVTSTDPESVIQTALAITAATLFIVAGPLHRILFNNWSISEALIGRMTLDEDTVHNIKSAKMRREVGIGLITQGEMKWLSKHSSYASPYSSSGLAPGPMPLSILTYNSSHRLIIDQDGVLVLEYGDGNSVQILPPPILDPKGHLQARRYDDQRRWYILHPGSCENYLVS